jgi:hypothetical protein
MAAGALQSACAHSTLASPSRFRLSFSAGTRCCHRRWRRRLTLRAAISGAVAFRVVRFKLHTPPPPHTRSPCALFQGSHPLPSPPPPPPHHHCHCPATITTTYSRTNSPTNHPPARTATLTPHQSDADVGKSACSALLNQMNTEIGDFDIYNVYDTCGGDSATRTWDDWRRLLSSPTVVVTNPTSPARHPHVRLPCGKNSVGVLAKKKKKG